MYVTLLIITEFRKSFEIQDKNRWFTCLDNHLLSITHLTIPSAYDLPTRHLPLTSS